MLALTVIATVVAVVSAVIAGLAYATSKNAAADAKRSADAAERSAGAALITAEADRAENHRQRQPRLAVTVDELAAHDGTEVIYRVTNEGPVDLDSVVVRRPVLGEVEGRIVHQVARTGGDYGDAADLGPIPLGTYERFTLSLGVNKTLPEFKVKVVCAVGDEDWTEVVTLDQPRRPPPPRVSRASIRR